VKPTGLKLVAKNKKAYFNYEVLDKVEAGLVLVGSEVKSLRSGKLQLVDAYAKIEEGEAWLIHAHIGDYDHAGAWAHDPTRKRKLLLKKKEIEKLAEKAREKGYTIIPLEVYFKEGRAKVLLGLCKGKAVHDKRKTIRDRDQQREVDRDLSER
jgi:SsrA-binding protein